jgi:transposase
MKEGVPLTTQRKKRSDVFLTPAVEKEISLYLKDNPFATAKEIIDDLDYDTSKTTMQRALKQMEYFYGSVKKQPLITESQKKSRIAFAKENLNTNWNNVIFADEMTAIAYSAPKMAYQKKGQRLSISQPKYPVKLNVWGGISVKGKTDIYIFQENMNASLYKEILDEQLLPDAKRLYGKRQWKLLHDNDPKHTSNVVNEFITNKRIKTVENWPSSSPDINPIENIWSMMKTDMNKKRTYDIDQLRDNIIESWNNIPQKYINNCIESMPKRLELVIENKGGKIAY